MKNKVGMQATKVPGPLTSAKELVVRRVNWTDKKRAYGTASGKEFL
jgi:hypothetical protein